MQRYNEYVKIWYCWKSRIIKKEKPAKAGFSHQIDFEALNRVLIFNSTSIKFHKPK